MHKEDCPWKNDWHRSLWHRCGEWEYELVIDQDGVFYGVKYLTGLHPADVKNHSHEHFKFKYCPLCGEKQDDRD